MTDQATQETTESLVDQTTPDPAPAAVDLTVNDLMALKNIVDVASQRGAFKANELEVVGKTYNRLLTFLNTVTKKEE